MKPRATIDGSRATSHESRATKEPQNQPQYDVYKEHGPIQFGPWTSASFRSDPKRFVFQLARYKFCAKMLQGKSKVLEVGCGDAPGVPIVLQAVGSIHGIDVEPLVIEDNLARFKNENLDPLSFALHDLIKKPLPKKFDAAYSLDVIEHIPTEMEKNFMKNLCRSLNPQAVCILGTPNQAAEAHASPFSIEGHVNLKNAETLKGLLGRYFHNVFLFSMNDEVVHTGFYPMAHYLLGIGVGVRKT